MKTSYQNLLSQKLMLLAAWFDSSKTNNHQSDSISLLRILPFIAIHLAVFAVIWVGFSWFAFWTAVTLYLIRMFAITGFYHRYFSHKNFKTSRLVQFIFAFIASTSAQRGPLWWASHHRIHHAKSDTLLDPHSPKHKGFFWSHTLWFLSDKNFSTNFSKIKDFAQYKELVWLDRFDFFAPTLLAISLYLAGEIIAKFHPQYETNGLQLLVWGFFISTVILYHATYTINSLAHRFGQKRFKTKDDSRNNSLLAILTLGEGWHNNHHYYPGTVRQGFQWWEIDITFYLLKIMSWFGLVWDLKPIPQRVKNEMRRGIQ
ncbi:acyl-CoA desaturase [Aliikangiella sp. IMCC44359]|uniref:acyl-CoA desaturase n=1 Tax=Aliikangiella sp. IMCC44359 TaxID=3459125 RepID=UPI00403AC862